MKLIHVRWIVPALLTLALTVPAGAEKDDLLDYLAAASFGQFVGEHMASALEAADEMQSAAIEASKELSAARRRFWASYPKGADRAAAEKEFTHLLWLKDFHYLSMAVADWGRRGMGSRPGPGQVMKMIAGDVDGGINPHAGPEFARWAEAIVRDIEAQAGGQSIESIMVPPGALLTAIDSRKDAYRVYQAARDWAEFDAANRDPEWVKTPRDYVAMVALRWGSKAPAEAVGIYDTMVEVLGEAHVQPVVDQVRKLGRDPDGGVKNLGTLRVFTVTQWREGSAATNQQNTPIPSGLAPLRARNPYTVLKALLVQGNPRHFLLGMIMNEHQTEDWTVANTHARRWQDAYGEQNVITAADRIRTAPKRMKDGWLHDPAPLGIRTTKPYIALQDLLAQSDPRGHVRLMLAFHDSMDNPGALDAAYAKVVAEHGEAKVLAAAKQIGAYWTLPRTMLPELCQDAMKRGAPGADDYKLWQAFLHTDPGMKKAGASGMMANPVYEAWARFAPGAQVTIKQDFATTWKHNNNRVELRPGAQMTEVLAESDAAKVVIANGLNKTHFTSRISPLFRMQAPISRIHQEKLKKIRSETIPVGSRSIVCDEYEKTEVGRSLTEPDLRQTTRICTSSEVPGGVVRYITEDEHTNYIHKQTQVVTAFSGSSAPVAKAEAEPVQNIDLSGLPCYRLAHSLQDGAARSTQGKPEVK